MNKKYFQKVPDIKYSPTFGTFTIYKKILIIVNSYINNNSQGYLYAILNGAKYIYETDSDITPTRALEKHFSFDAHDYGLTLACQNSSRLVNVNAHFGQPLVCPRGFPKKKLDDSHIDEYIGGRRKTSPVQYGVLNGDPDEDPISRFKYPKESDIKFDESSPSILFPSFRMAPYNSQNTFFHYQAFWSLYLPTTVSFELSDIWRSYWAQRLLWLLDDTVTFFGPNAYRASKPQSSPGDTKNGKSTHSQTEQLIDFLFEWKCTKLKFYECVIELSSKMAEENFWGNQEVNGIKSWLKDLTAIGYVEPVLKVNASNLKTSNLCGSKQFQKITEVIYIIIQ